jgi:hypothetical protein
MNSLEYSGPARLCSRAERADAELNAMNNLFQDLKGRTVSLRYE